MQSILSTLIAYLYEVAYVILLQSYAFRLAFQPRLHRHNLLKALFLG